MKYEVQQDTDKPDITVEHLNGFASDDGKAFQCGTISFSRTGRTSAFVQGRWGSTSRSGEFKKNGG